MKLGSVLAVRKNEVESLSEALILRKSKYVKKWKGKDGKWHYKYGKELKGGKKPSKAEIAKNLEQGRSDDKKKLANKIVSKLKTNIDKKNEGVKDIQLIPQNVKTLTVDNVTSLIKQTVKMTLKRIKDNQDTVSYQKQKAYKEKNAKAYWRLEVMENIYQAAVDIKEFRFTTASAWAKDIVGKIK